MDEGQVAQDSTCRLPSSHTAPAAAVVWVVVLLFAFPSTYQEGGKDNRETLGKYFKRVTGLLQHHFPLVWEEEVEHSRLSGVGGVPIDASEMTGYTRGM